MFWSCIFTNFSYIWQEQVSAAKFAYIERTYGCESKRFGIEQVLVDIPFNTPFNTLLNRRVPIVQYPPFNTLVQLVYLPFSFVLKVISRVAENSIEAKRMIGKIQNDLFHLLAYSTHTVILSATGSAAGFLR